MSAAAVSKGYPLGVKRLVVAAASLALFAVAILPASASDTPGTQASSLRHSRPFTSNVSRLDRGTRKLIVGSSWRPGCPVPISKLRLVDLTYWGFNGNGHYGRLIVHRRWAGDVVTVFQKLYEDRFPIRRMRLVDYYGADDSRSMAADNTSAFNCRWRAGSPGVWSQHAYGRAIDIDPVENPMFVPPNGVYPLAGRPFLNRHRHRRGMIHTHDDTVKAFAAIGWKWGGTWKGTKDWQHFSANGR